jgi:hypothetical protein
MDGDAIRARDRLLLAGIGAATLPATFDFDTGRDLPALFAFAAAVLTTAGDSFGVPTGAAGVASLRPRPRALAMVERCSE